MSEGEVQFDPENRRRTLEEQLEKPEALDLPGGRVPVLDVSPEHAKTEVPTMIAPCRGVRPDVYRYNIEVLVGAGRRVVAVDAIHGVDTQEEGDKPHIEQRKAAAMLQTLQAKGIDRTDVLAHSEGGLYAVMAAVQEPARFRNLVLVNPAGIIGRDSPWRLGKGFIEDSKVEAARRAHKTDRDATDPKQFLKDILAKPGRAFQEALAISQSDIRDMLRYLKEKGIGVSIIHAADDRGFPMERVQVERRPNESEKEYQDRVEKVRRGDVATAGESRGNINTTMVDGFYSVEGSHNELIQRPDLYTKLVEHALTAMEKKHEKSENKT